MLEIVNRKTGETIIFPTPEGGPVDIDTLPLGDPLTEEEMLKWFEFHKKKKSKLDKLNSKLNESNK